MDEDVTREEGLEPLFPALPENLADASDEDLATWEGEHLDAIQKIRDKDADFLGDPELRTASVILAELKAGIDALRSIQAIQTERAEAEQNFDAELESMTAEVLAVKEPTADDDEDDDEDGKPDEPQATAAVEDAETLAADDEDEPKAEEKAEEESVEIVASKARPMRRRAAAVSRRHEPVVMRPEGHGLAKLHATMEFGGVRAGQPLDKSALVSLFDDAIVRTEGMTQRTVLASARATFGDAERLTKDGTQSHRVITDVRQEIRSRDMEEIVASGGRCAPFTPRYDLPFIATDDTPVWNSLAQTGADRGGIIFPTPIGISDVTDGITIVTAEQDAAGGGSATKTCVVVDCDEFQSAETEAVAACVEHGNFGARSWPERVDNLADLLRVAHGAAIETEILTQIKDGSTNLNDEAKYGAVSTLLQGIVKAAAMMRNRHRMDPNAVLNSLIPAHAVDLMVADVNHVAFNRFVARAEMEALLRRFNVNPTFYIDSADDGNMLYGANGATNLDEFKTTVEWGLYPPDTWLGLDGGRLDLGLVRDSVLNATNDFQLFFEVWIGLAKIGVESLWVTSTVCPSGATAPAGTLITCA